jgi:hypothetical protein
MPLKQLVAEIAELCDYGDCLTVALDLSSLGITNPCHPLVSAYFSQHVPEYEIDGPYFRLLSPPDIATETSEYTPSRHILPFGFITIASDHGRHC